MQRSRAVAGWARQLALPSAGCTRTAEAKAGLDSSANLNAVTTTSKWQGCPFWSPQCGPQGLGSSPRVLPSQQHPQPMSYLPFSVPRQRAYHSSRPNLLSASLHLRDEQRGHSDSMRREVQDVMDDPMARLMASRGMPLGLSLHQRMAREPRSVEEEAAATAATSNNEHAGTSCADGNSAAVGGSAVPTGQPGYPMEALDEIMQAAHGAATTPDANGSRDSWGTTRESAAEIARRIAESNDDTCSAQLQQEFDAAAAAADAATAAAGAEPDDLRLSADEAKYKTLEAMSKDIKDLDEVFEVLASVPWLDEGDVEQKQLRGMAQLALLGTLEEVGFQIADQVRRIWEGERDHGIILEGTSAKDQAALISVMFHTKIIQDKYGPPQGVVLKPERPGKAAAEGGVDAASGPTGTA